MLHVPRVRQSSFPGRPPAAAALVLAAPLVAFTLGHASARSPSGLQGAPANDPRFELIDVGTLGGRTSVIQPFAHVLNERGTVVGGADTGFACPGTPDDCVPTHAFRWDRGVMTDLGGLAGHSSGALGINDRGDIVVGASLNGLPDPDLAPFGQRRAVMWRDGRPAVDLGTLGGSQSRALSVNNRGQIVGSASNAIPARFSLAPFADILRASTEMHAALWDDEGIHDLGTLGGEDSQAQVINDRGQVAGMSHTAGAPVPSPVGPHPPIHGFFWEDGIMTDIGTFGGTLSQVFAMNERGTVAGEALFAGDAEAHAFLWERGKLTDLGTLGGHSSVAFALNFRRDAVGFSTLAEDGLFHATLWRNGTVIDLGTVGDDALSWALAINASDQVVGSSFAGPGHVLFSEDGGPAMDLQTLIVRGPAAELVDATAINDRGVIAGTAVFPNGDLHVVLLVPTDDRAGDGRDHRARFMSPDERSRVMASRMHDGRYRLPRQ